MKFENKAKTKNGNENDKYYITIIYQGGSRFIWRNRANVEWNLSANWINEVDENDDSSTEEIEKENEDLEKILKNKKSKK